MEEQYKDYHIEIYMITSILCLCSIWMMVDIATVSHELKRNCSLPSTTGDLKRDIVKPSKKKQNDMLVLSFGQAIMILYSHISTWDLVGSTTTLISLQMVFYAGFLLSICFESRYVRHMVRDANYTKIIEEYKYNHNDFVLDMMIKCYFFLGALLSLLVASTSKHFKWSVSMFFAWQSSIIIYNIIIYEVYYSRVKNLERNNSSMSRSFITIFQFRNIIMFIYVYVLFSPGSEFYKICTHIVVNIILMGLLYYVHLLSLHSTLLKMKDKQ